MTLSYDPTDPLGDVRRGGPDHHGARRIPERAGLQGRLGPRLHAPWLQDKDGDGVFALITTKTRLELGVQGRARAVLDRELPCRQPSMTVAGRRSEHDVRLRQGYS